MMVVVDHEFVFFVFSMRPHHICSGNWIGRCLDRWTLLVSKYLPCAREMIVYSLRTWARVAHPPTVISGQSGCGRCTMRIGDVGRVPQSGEPMNRPRSLSDSNRRSSASAGSIDEAGGGGGENEAGEVRGW
jgi:hypothetical protein